MKDNKIRKSLWYVFLFVIFNALSNGQESQRIGDALNRGTTASPGSGAAAPPESQPDSQSVICNGNQLKISSNNSTLARILAEIQKCTGANIEVPDGTATNRVSNRLGPGPTRDVLASLLSSNDFDYVIGSSPSDPDRVETVLLMPRQGDATTGGLPESSLTAINSADLQTREDGKPESQPAQVSRVAPPAAPDTITGKVPAADQVEKPVTSAVQSSAANQASPVFGASPALLVSSNSTPLNASPRAVRPMAAVAQARIPSNGVINQTRWRDELTRFGISADTSDEGLTYVAATASVKAAHRELTWYPVNLPSREDNPGSADAPGPILLPAVVKGQMPQGESASIGNENGGVIRSSYYDPMEKYSESYVAYATADLSDRTQSPSGYPVLLEQLGEVIWQADRRLGLIVPVILMILILLCQVFVASRVKTRIFLLAVPLSAIGAMWSLCLMHSNSAVAVWMGIIGLLSIQAEAGVFRLLHLERANERAKSRGDL
jgi:hypothetical protein